jgi:hypothetical protein
MNLLLPDYTKPWKNCVIFLVGLIATLGGLWTLWKIHTTPAGTSRPEWAKTALILWTILPPLWFWGEYWLLWRHDACALLPQALEKFKHAQELGRNVWIAFVALLAAFYFK